MAQKRTKTIIWMKFCMRCELSPKSWRNFPRVSFRRTFAGDLTRLGQGQYFIAFERFKYPRAIPKRSPDSSRVIVIVPSDEKERRRRSIKRWFNRHASLNLLFASAQNPKVTLRYIDTSGIISQKRYEQNLLMTVYFTFWEHSWE